MCSKLVNRFCMATLAVFGVLLTLAPCHAGIDLIHGEVFIDGLQKPRAAAQGDVVELCYRGSRYSFSGMRNEIIYTVFMLTPKLHIENSVGKSGVNHRKDVKKIQQVLRKLRYYRGPVNGTYDQNLSNAIEKVQRELAGLSSADGRIDVKGKTITAIRIANADSLFVNETDRLGQRSGKIALRECVSFFAPQRVLGYDIYYCELSYIIDYEMGIAVVRDGASVNLLNANEERDLKAHLNRYANKVKKAGSLTVTSKEKRPRTPFTVNLKVNDKALVLEKGIAPGFSQDPLKFSWYIDPGYPGDVKHSFRLAPHEEKWSPWSGQKEVRYFFLHAGAHVFEVRTKYSDASGEWVEVPKASYDFDLNRAFVSKPELKVISGSPDSPSLNLESIDIDDVYRGSKALLIGINEFLDPTFSDLTYVGEDIDMMERTLSNLGFEVSTQMGKVEKRDILQAIERLVAEADEGDRIVIYFSTHGFPDRNVPTRAYIAPYDCIPDDASRTCIELDELEALFRKMTDKPVKHLLAVLDACASGLGVIAKDLSYKEIRISTENGSHMLTAGMVDQVAQMDHRLKMSTFTHYLAKGLSGEADLFEDNVISISELLLYVRYQVAKETDGRQTPMMGRITGAGEMIFKSR